MTVKYVQVSADQMQKVYEQLKNLTDDTNLPSKWPCFYFRTTTKEGKTVVERPSCVVIHAATGAIDEMCVTCQLLYRLQELEREAMRQIRVQQMMEAGRA